MANLFAQANAPTIEPQSFVIGDFVQWKRTDLFEDYPHTVFAITYVSRELAGSGGAEFSVSGSVTSNEWVFSIPSATSAAFTAGDYFWQLEVVRSTDSNRIVIERGNWKILQDLDVNTDPRSHAEIMVAKIESLLEGRADSDVDSYSIAGRSLSKLSFEDLSKAADYFRAKVKQERARNRAQRGLSTGATIKASF